MISVVKNQSGPSQSRRCLFIHKTLKIVVEGDDFGNYIVATGSLQVIIRSIIQREKKKKPNRFVQWLCTMINQMTKETALMKNQSLIDSFKRRLFLFSFMKLFTLKQFSPATSQHLLSSCYLFLICESRFDARNFCKHFLPTN